MNIFFDNYEIKDAISLKKETEIYRAHDLENKRNVILKIIKSTNEFNIAVVNLKNEFEILNMLSDHENILKTYGFQKYEEGYFLVVEDNIGITLDKYFKERSLNIIQFLKIAIKICEILFIIHKNKIIHKDIKPDNIIINSENLDIKIIDFGISVNLSKEDMKWSTLNVLEGSIEYIAPERTSRMNRTVDYRSDFYSLGVTFYELLTKKLPFESDDLLELIHFHLAKNQISVNSINNNIPIILSNIIDKLMEKNPEDRYQTVYGLKIDLEKCLAELENNNLNFEFKLAEKDIPDELIIQQKLYGRNNEIKELKETFENIIKTGNSEIFLIGGYSGIGKTSLVKEIGKPITASHGYFITGKYDQYNKDIPFSALINAFNNLINLILTEKENEIKKWKKEILEAIGGNGKILTNLIPELEFIIGKQSEIIELSGQENANRFYKVFQDFIKVFSKKEHPLTVFLDDLQWVDGPSLSIIQNLTSDESLQYLFLILAYRDNEVTIAHPFQMFIDNISKSKSNIRLKKIILKSLEQENIKEILTDCLYSDSEEIDEIAKIIKNKTGGNSFFSNELIKEIYKEKLIYFDYEKNIWNWKFNDIKKIEISDNIVELLIKKISGLKYSTQNLLKLASCIGNTFDLSMLCLINQRSIGETIMELKTAIANEIIFSVDNSYKLLDMIDEKDEISNLVNAKIAKLVKYKFQHDKIQEASYALVEDEVKIKLRLKIARLLNAETNLNKKEEFLFDIVNHFNAGLELITDDEEFKLIINLNLKAGKKAKISTAYKPSLEYLNKAYEIVMNWVGEKKAWEDNYSLILEIMKELAEVQYLNGNFENSEMTIKNILLNSQNSLDKGEAYNLLIIQYCSLGKYDKAFEIINKSLELLDESLPQENISNYLEKELLDLKLNLRDRKVSDLLNEDELKDPHKKLTIKILTNSLPMAYNLKPELFPIISAKMVNIFLKNGMSAESYGISCYSIVLATGFGDYKNAYDYSLLAVRLSEKYNNLAEKAKGSNVLANYTTPFVNHLKNAEKINNEGLQACYDSGEFLHGSYCAMNVCLNSFYQGTLLNLVLSDKVEKMYHFALKIKSSLSIDTIAGVKIIASNLIGNTNDKNSFDIQDLSEKEYYKICEDHQSMFPICLYKIMKAQVKYYYDDLDSALNEINEAKQILPFISGQNSNTEFNFYHSLILCALFDTVDKTKKEEYLIQIKNNQKQMKMWAKSCSENFTHKYLLVQAEIARIENKNWKAIKLYEKAIAETRRNDFIQTEALANELLGKFWFDKKNHKIAQYYLSNAYQKFEVWGAVHKIKILKEKYANFFTLKQKSEKELKISSHSYDDTVKQDTLSLDFQSVIKSSVAISKEIKIEKLLEKIISIVIENAGAERGVLLLKDQNDELYIEAENDVSDSSLNILKKISINDYNKIPISLVNYVERVQTDIILYEAFEDETFGNDEYIKNNKIKSIICMPILKQNETIGIIYLENNLVAGAFTVERLQTISVLCSQAAISIDNAFVYENLEEKVKERTIELNETNEKLEQKNEDILNSIHYAKTIQSAILSNENNFPKILPNFFINFFPKDIVSGDFLWFTENEDSAFIAVADCTGHGVPGAFMSIIGSTFLNQIVKEMKIFDPSLILENLNIKIRTALKQDTEENNSRDGMEICLCKIDKDKIIFSGANRPLYYVKKDGEVIKVKGNFLPIGGKQKDGIKKYTNNEISLDGSIMSIYLTSDGIQDQIDENGQKIGSNGFSELIKRNYLKNANDQKSEFETKIKISCEKQIQRDDISIIGILFN